MSQVWKQDWQQRIRDRVLEKGYKSLTEFAETKPKATFFELAAELGSDVAPIQVEGILCDEADKLGKIESYARTSLFRHLRQSLPNNWAQNTDFEFRLVSALTDWESRLPPGYEEKTAFISKELQGKTKMNSDWFPESIDDPFIVNAFQKSGFDKE